MGGMYEKILMRGGMTPLDNFTPETVIAKNSIGSNSGNLLYAYGVYRTLMTEDTIIDVDYYGVEETYSEKDIARINEEYDAYVCPLANAFRKSFEENLIKYANFFDKLTIPCYIIGIGLNAPYEPEIGASRPFDEAAKKFVKAALEKSSIIGLRGEITGENLSQRSLYLSKTLKIAFNLSNITPENIVRFAFHEMQTYPDHHLIEQNRDELKLLYYGTQYIPNKDASILLSREISHPLIQENRYHCFINIPTWLDFLRGIDLSIGSKLHGNVVDVLSGCPALFMPLDSRMRELVAYHDFPAIPHMQVKEDDQIEKLVQKVDMTSHLKKHKANFERFVGFLNKNSVPHIYLDDIGRKDAPLDKKIAQISYHEVESILHRSNQEVTKRIG